MNIYVAHATSFDYQNELYRVIRKSELNERHNIILPHEKGLGLFNSKDFFKKDCDLVIAEVSYPSIGVGIELGWADALGIPMVCMHKKGTRISKSILAITNHVFAYNDSEDIPELITEYIH